VRQLANRIGPDVPRGRGEVDVICIYEIEGGKIAKAWFKVGDAAASRIWILTPNGGRVRPSAKGRERP
jgi:hypothetical protein